ncbi:MAG: hypothetical protein R2852_02935 [Bacteroidia bacterium]
MKETMLIIHFIGLAMGIGTSFAFMFLGIAAAKMEKEEAQAFTLKTLSISTMGHIGLTLLIISGIYLILPFRSMLMDMPLLMTKLGLVVVLAALIGILSSTAKKARQGNAEQHLKKMEGLGKVSMLVGLTIIVLATFQFH